MNKNIIFSLMAVVVLLTACNHWDAPEFTVPVYSGPEANKTIADIKAVHTSLGTGAQDSICRYDETFIVKATVVSSDQGGNCYKYLTIQDETGGIEISIDRSSLYNDYPVGQTVYLDCRGLIVGDYNNKHQIGWKDPTSVRRIHHEALPKYLHKDGLPNPNNPLVAEPIEINGSADLNMENVNCLVKINGCKFTAESNGQPLSLNDFITDREVTINGASIIVRTSNYANFRNIIIDASKEYCLYGILSVYKSEYQLALRTKEDIVAGSAPQQPELVSDYVFNSDCFTSGGWSQYPENQAWKFQYYEGNNFVYHQSASAPCDDWLISPEITVDDFSNMMLYLDHQNNVGGSLASYYQVYYSTTYNGGDFDESEWTAFSPNLNVYPMYFDLSNALSLENVGNNKFRIALRYRMNGSVSGTRWSVRGYKLYRKAN